MRSRADYLSISNVGLGEATLVSIFSFFSGRLQTVQKASFSSLQMAFRKDYVQIWTYGLMVMKLKPHIAG